VLEGYVKSNFASVYNNKLNKNIGCGSLTDGIYKLEIHIINFKEDDFYVEDKEIRKGDKIEVVGKISNTGKCDLKCKFYIFIRFIFKYI